MFYYRSANPATLEMLSRFLPVPIDELRAEFAAGATPVDVCARSIRELRGLGVRHFYVSNLPLAPHGPRPADDPRQSRCDRRRRVAAARAAFTRS